MEAEARRETGKVKLKIGNRTGLSVTSHVLSSLPLETSIRSYSSQRSLSSSQELSTGTVATYPHPRRTVASVGSGRKLGGF